MEATIKNKTLNLVAKNKQEANDLRLWYIENQIMFSKIDIMVDTSLLINT